MLKSKILFKISGSIAAYKSAYLISKLVQNGFEVQTVATNSSLQFIGKATLEGLTGKPILIDQYEDGKMMSHINLMKWADLIIFCPASANTINKMANGIADNLVTSLFLAHNWDKPYLIAPAMNTAMYKHPATQESLNRLKDWGVGILPTDSGHLACGDIGEGKLFDPDRIYDHIVGVLNNNNGNSNSKKSILITAGATREFIDGVRFITNMSTGNTASVIADHLSSNGYKINYLHGINTLLPKNKANNIQYRDFKNFKETFENLLENNSYDIVIHLAAISDYTVDEIKSNETSLSGSGKGKLDSGFSSLTINLKPTSKIVDKIKLISKNKDVVLFAFKFSGSSSLDESKNEVDKLFKHSNADFVVLNHLHDRTKNELQSNFYVFNKSDLLKNVTSADQLAEVIEQTIKLS
jgi:phosphopantothenoylcysteine decarboxylase / phosphopantothenate---cysteine ligase